MSVPPIDTLPENDASPIKVDNPVIFRFLASISPPLKVPAVTIPEKFALLPPTFGEKLPTNDVAVTIPALIFPFVHKNHLHPLLLHQQTQDA